MRGITPERTGRRQPFSVHVAATSPEPIDGRDVMQRLVQSDLGGDIERWSVGPSSVEVSVVAFAATEQRARDRVVARVRDALGRRWTVHPNTADPERSAVALS
jgi:hypothetical protein